MDLSVRFDRALLALLLVISAALMSVAPASPAFAAQGSISGRVTTSSGSLQLPIVVAAYYKPAGLTDYIYLKEVAVNSAGNYTLGALDPGTYKIRFGAENGLENQPYLQQWYSAKTEATANIVTVADGADVTGINANLVLGGSISGHVTGPGAAALTDAVHVHAFSSSQTFTGVNGYGCGCAGSGIVNSNGNYVIRGLAAGTYKVYFAVWRDPMDDTPEAYGSQWSAAKTSQASARTWNVTLGANTPGADAMMALPGVTPTAPPPANPGTPGTPQPPTTPAAPAVVAGVSTGSVKPDQMLKGQLKTSLGKSQRMKLPRTTAAGDPLSWKSKTTGICTVRKGKVTGEKHGHCVLLARTDETAAAAYKEKFVIRIR